MNRKELLDALTVERFGPHPIGTRPVFPTANYDDSDIITARRRRELAAAINAHDDYETGAA